MDQKRHFDTALEGLKAQLMQMGQHVELAIDAATRTLLQRDLSLLKDVFANEKAVNVEQREVDEACMNLIALRQPMAADLRLIIAILRINTDLERMGDQAVNIGYNCEHYLKYPELKPLLDLPRMADEVKSMVKLSLEAFVKHDPILAREVLMKDDSVDHAKSKILRDVIELMKKMPEKMDAGISLIFIARNLERIGDHATNIAEDVIFAVSGEDIRHPRDRQTP